MDEVYVVHLTKGRHEAKVKVMHPAVCSSCGETVEERDTVRDDSTEMKSVCVGCYLGEVR